jgi:hypothetical protein
MKRTGFSKVRTALGAAMTAPVIMLTPFNDTVQPHGEAPVVLSPIGENIPTNPDVLISGYKWAKSEPNDSSPLIITYGFPENPAPYVNKDSTFQTLPLQTQQRAAFRQLTEEFERVANVKFVEHKAGITTNAKNVDPSSPMISVSLSPELYQINTTGKQKTKEIVAALASYPNSGPGFGNSRQALSASQTTGTTSKRSFSNYIMLHETGHNLGLRHPDKAELPSNALTVGKDHDSVETSIMSNGYIAKKSQVIDAKRGIKREDGHSPAGLMPLDVAALQKLYGANTSYRLTDDTHYFSGANDTRAIWNGGSPYALDASRIKSSDKTDIRLDANPGKVSVVGDELMFNPLNAIVTTLRASPQGAAELMGSEKGGTRFEGGSGSNLYQFFAKGNVIVSPTDAKKSVYTPAPGSTAVIEGFDAKRDEIQFLYPKSSDATAYRDGKDLVLEIGMGRMDSATLIFKDYKGKAEDIYLRQFLTADRNADLGVSTITFPAKESSMPAWLHKAISRDSEPRTR